MVNTWSHKDKNIYSLYFSLLLPSTPNSSQTTSKCIHLSLPNCFWNTLFTMPRLWNEFNAFNIYDFLLNTRERCAHCTVHIKSILKVKSVGKWFKSSNWFSIPNLVKYFQSNFHINFEQTTTRGSSSHVCMYVWVYSCAACRIRVCPIIIFALASIVCAVWWWWWLCFDHCLPTFAKYTYLLFIEKRFCLQMKNKEQ